MKKFLASSIIMLSCLSLFSQKLATFSVDAGEYARENAIVGADISTHGISLAGKNLELREVGQSIKASVPHQLEGGHVTKIWWIMSGETAAHTIRTYELWEVSDQAVRKGDVHNDGASVTVGYEGAKAFTYQYAKAKVPEGVSDVYSRGGYIHPLFSPGGSVLTRIQPPDHYHHYGVWNPWTHTKFKDREIDFWNLNKEQGRIDVAAKPQVITGAVYSEVNTRHNHVVLPDSGMTGIDTALVEDLNIRLWNNGARYWLIDHLSTQQCASDEPLLLEEYRYQGFGYRALADWNDENVRLITSEGKTKSDANATRARWCKVSGPVEQGQAGILFMTHPNNYNFPELLRIWPVGANKGVENVFVNFNPTQDRDWELTPNHAYTLKYRMVVYDGELSEETAEKLWRDYAYPVKVSVRIEQTMKGKKVLVFTKNGEGFVHDNLEASVAAIKKLGNENGFEVIHSDSSSIFTSPDLRSFDAIIFSNTNNQTFDNNREKVAFQNYIRQGGGFVGIHSATGSERTWPWYQKLVGGKFLRHPPFQKFKIEVLDKSHPSTEFLPDIWEREDECYFIHKLNPTNHVLLAAQLPAIVDTKKEEYPGDTWADLVPLAWYHEFDGGKQWYTALGHAIEHYSDPIFMKHVLGGLQWVCEKD